MKLLFLHHQQRFDYREEPGYNELFRPFTKAKQVTAWREFVYQTMLRGFLIDELARRGKKVEGNPSYFIMRNLDVESYNAANLALLPILRQVIGNTSPDLIVYSLTWATEAIHPVILGQLKKDFPRVKLFTQQWDYEEGPASGFFHSVEGGTVAASDYFSIMDNHDRLRRMKKRVPPYDTYQNVECVHWLPTVPDPAIYCTPDPGVPKSTDILMVGSGEGHRGDIISALRQRYGERFQHRGGQMPGEKHLSLTDYVAAINGAKITVNTQTVPERVQLKGRVREVLSCGGFLLEEDNSESREFLEGSGAAFFDGTPDLFAKIDAYLADEPRREEVARTAYEWYRARYTPDLAMQQIIDAIS
jgi:hypothetical protein